MKAMSRDAGQSSGESAGVDGTIRGEAGDEDPNERRR
jgi:hypothetical protein